jgi:hypothetical protein
LLPDALEEGKDLLVFLGVDDGAVSVGSVMAARELFFPELGAPAAEGRVAHVGKDGWFSAHD